jgi:hypothetical protein
VLFLFNFTDRHLYGVFQATGNGGLDLQPDAWKTTSDNGRGFPAQLPFEELFNFLPVPEKRIKHLFDSNIRITGLSAWQVMELIKIYGDYEAEIATTAASKIVQHFGNTCANAGVDVSQGAAVAASPAPQSGGQGIHCPFDFIFFALYLYFCFAISLKSGEPLKGRRKFQHLGTWYHLFLLSTTDTHNVIAWSLKQPKFFMKTNWYAYI